MLTHSKYSCSHFLGLGQSLVTVASHLQRRARLPPGQTTCFRLARPSAAQSNGRCVSGQFPECLAAVMAAPGWSGATLSRVVVGFWQWGPVAAREWAARFPSLSGCQRRCVTCVAGAAFSGPRLASASRRYGQNSALDRFLGLSQPDGSLTSRIPAVSMHRGKGPRSMCPELLPFLSMKAPYRGNPSVWGYRLGRAGGMVTENKGRERQRGRWRRAVEDLTGERYQILRGQQSTLYSGRE